MDERLRALLNSYLGLILINTAFQIGFCTFVLSNYMKALPHELYESAEVDGASVWRQYWQITMPLCRPALAALATLQVTWIYNEFFWATVLLQSGDKFPITSSLNNLKGQFFVDYNLLSAGSVVVALPPDHRLLRAPEAVRRRSHPRRHQGLTTFPGGSGGVPPGSTQPQGTRSAKASATSSTQAIALPIGRSRPRRCSRGHTGSSSVQYFVPTRTIGAIWPASAA